MSMKVRIERSLLAAVSSNDHNAQDTLFHYSGGTTAPPSSLETAGFSRL